MNKNGENENLEKRVQKQSAKSELPTVYYLEGNGSGNTTCHKEDSAEEKKPTYKELEAALEKYIRYRRAEKNNNPNNFFGRKYNTFFGKIAGMSADLKIDTAETLLKICLYARDKADDPAYELSKDQLAALKDQRLGLIYEHYEEEIKDAINVAKQKAENIVNSLYP
jgi:hypothetical protein